MGVEGGSPPNHPEARWKSPNVGTLSHLLPSGNISRGPASAVVRGPSICALPKLSSAMSQVPESVTARTFVLSATRDVRQLLTDEQEWKIRDDLNPVLMAGGSDTLRCGHCDFTIALAVKLVQVRREVLVCPCCGWFNAVTQDAVPEDAADRVVNQSNGRIEDAPHLQGDG